MKDITTMEHDGRGHRLLLWIAAAAATACLGLVAGVLTADLLTMRLISAIFRAIVDVFLFMQACNNIGVPWHQ